MKERVYVVDSLSEGVASLVEDQGLWIAVARDRLPGGTAESDVLRVPEKPDGAPDWSRARIDAVETERRLARARRTLRKLRKRDPGGDVEL